MNRNKIICFALLITSGTILGCLSKPDSTSGIDKGNINENFMGKMVELNRPQEPEKPYPYVEEEVVYKNKKAGISLAGTLTLPRLDGKFPAVILITGGGQQDRDEAVSGHRPFLVLADNLTRRGIAVLRVDDRGIGGSTGDFSLATSEDFAGDVLAEIGTIEETISPVAMNVVSDWVLQQVMNKDGKGKL